MLVLVSLFAIICQKKLFIYESRGIGANYITTGLFWNNLGSVFTGLLNLEYAYPSDGTTINVMSYEGMYYLVNLILMIIEIIGVIYTAIDKNLRKKEYNRLLCSLVICEIVVFSIIDLSYFKGEPVYQYRYLINIHLCVILLCCQYIDKLFQKGGVIAIIAVMILIYYSNINADCSYVVAKNNYNMLLEYVKDIEDYDDEIVYMIDDEEITEGIYGNTLGINSPVWYDTYMMKLIDEKHIYKLIKGGVKYVHWADTIRLDNIEEYRGPIIIAVRKGKEFLVPIEIKQEANKIKDNGKYTLYEMQENKYQF